MSGLRDNADRCAPLSGLPLNKQTRMALQPTEIDDRIAAFKGDLATLSLRDIVRRHIISGSCAALEEDAYYGLRAAVAAKYELHPNEVLVVGSGKLGFSIAPQKRYRHFSDTSDIDVVVLSPNLFRRVWRSVHSYEEQGGFWGRAGSFKDYLFQGWIRPDMLPNAPSFEIANDWWKFFNSLSSSGQYSPYKIRGALYEDWYFLESYQARAVSSCVDDLRNMTGDSK